MFTKHLYEHLYDHLLRNVAKGSYTHSERYFCECVRVKVFAKVFVKVFVKVLFMKKVFAKAGGAQIGAPWNSVGQEWGEIDILTMDF